MSKRRRNRAPALLDLPPAVFENVCVSLDSGTVHNWRALVPHLKDYTIMDVRQLSIVEQRNESASNSLLCDLNSRGWTVLDLAELAVKANAMEVLQIVTDYCRERHPEVVLPTGAPPLSTNNSQTSQLSGHNASSVSPNSAGPSPQTADIISGANSNTDAEREWKGAKTCHHREGYPSSIPPPVGAQDEALRRYGLAPGSEIVNERSRGGTVNGHGQEATSTASHVSGSLTSQSLNSPQRSQLTNECGSETSEGTRFSLESLSLSPHLTEVPYAELDSASAHFDQTLFRDGGHKLGSGGFGEVFYCKLELGGREREVAVKALLTKDELVGGADLSSVSMESTERRQFVTEIQALSNLSHAHLLPVLGYSCDGPRLCLIYPYMANGSLDAHLKDHTHLTPGARVQVACDVSSALAYLHCQAHHIVIHRDVKSANILLTVDWRGMLGDFGVARSLPSTEHTSLHTTTVVGTRVYMAHEFSQGTISPAADTYAFGVVLYELLTGYCAHNVKISSGEETDLITYIDECDDVDELMGAEWACHKEAWKSLWQLAESCAEHNRHRRPSSMTVLSQLEKILLQIQRPT